MQVSTVRVTTSALLAAAGPAAVGAVMGLGTDWRAAPLLVVALPAVVLGVAALTTPALYIGAAFAGVAPSPRAAGAAAGSALADMGRVMLGLAPPLLFLAATAGEGATVAWLGRGAVLLAALVGLRLLKWRLFDDIEDGGRGVAVFGTWALVALGIGLHLLNAVLP